MAVKPAAQHIALSEFPPAVQDTVKLFDLSGDGNVDAVELARAARLYQEASDRAKIWRKAAVILGCVLVVTVGLLLGVTYGIVMAARETQVDGDKLVSVKDKGLVKVNGMPGLLRPSSYVVEKQSGGRRKMLADDVATKIGEVDRDVVLAGTKILCGGTRDLSLQLPSSVGNLNKDQGDTFFNMRILDSKNVLCSLDGEASIDSSKSIESAMVNLNSNVGYILNCGSSQSACSFSSMSKTECTRRGLTHIADCSDCSAWLDAHGYS